MCLSSLSQTEGAEESQFFLCCDVRFEQQCGAQTLQDLGGEETPQCRHAGIKRCDIIYLALTLTVTTCFVLSAAENPQQDKKDLLCL